MSSQVIKVLDILTINESYNEGYHVIAHGLGIDCDCSFYTQPLAQKFQQTLEQAIQRAKGKSSPTSSDPSLSVEERLQRLTRLRAAKLITDVEFEQKRKDILNEL